MGDLKAFFPGIVKQDYRIKTSIMLAILRILINILQCRKGNALDFGVANVFHGRSYRVIGTCFDFNKNELLIFFYN